MQTLSVKKLRENFPKVIKALKTGHKFLIIYKSEIIAQLSPPPNNYIRLRKLMTMMMK